MGSTLIYYQRVPTDGARRLGCAGILDLCCRLPASGLLRPEARWPDKVLFSAEKSGALRASGLRAEDWNGFGASGGAALRLRFVGWLWAVLIFLGVSTILLMEQS